MTSKQRAFLRGLANPLDSTFQIGKGGLNENMIRQYDEYLTARELVKTNILKSCEDSPRDLAHKIAESLDAYVVMVVGRRFVLYRRSEKLATEGRSIILPW